MENIWYFDCLKCDNNYFDQILSVWIGFQKGTEIFRTLQYWAIECYNFSLFPQWCKLRHAKKWNVTQYNTTTKTASEIIGKFLPVSGWLILQWTSCQKAIYFTSNIFTKNGCFFWHWKEPWDFRIQQIMEQIVIEVSITVW